MASDACNPGVRSGLPAELQATEGTRESVMGTWDDSALRFTAESRPSRRRNRTEEYRIALPSTSPLRRWVLNGRLVGKYFPVSLSAPRFSCMVFLSICADGWRNHATLLPLRHGSAGRHLRQFAAPRKGSHVAIYI